MENAATSIDALGGRPLPLPLDVADAPAVFAAAERVEHELGPIDVWVNNAMVTVYSHVVDTPPEEFRRVTEVTYLGQVHGTLAALRHMRPRNSGTIVSIGSALAYRSIPLQAAYCGAKAATRGFIDSLRSELMHENSAVRLSTVHLPAVNTPQFDWARSRLPRKLQPVPPIFQPETIAAAVLKAAREAPRELWVGTPAVKAIIGQMLAPALADRILARNGEDSEMTDEPADRHRPDNLFGPVDSVVGAHGRFDAEATQRAIPFNPTWLRVGAALAGFGVVAAAAGLGAALARSARPAGSRKRVRG